MDLRQGEDLVFFVNDHVVSSIVVTLEPKIVYKHSLVYFKHADGTNWTHCNLWSTSANTTKKKFKSWFRFF